MITFQFFGTSHGEGYFGFIEGLPEGATFSVTEVNKQLALRKNGYGRSNRQQFGDFVYFNNEVNSSDVTVKGKLSFFVANDSQEQRPEITALRSGHSDVVGRARFEGVSVRRIAEYTSARNSLCYVVLGAICKQILGSHGIYTYHYVEKIGGIGSCTPYEFGRSEKEQHFGLLHCPCRFATVRMCNAIDRARLDGNSLGGVVAVGAKGVPMGVGEIAPYSARLDAVIAANMMGIPSVKGITFGIGDKYGDIDGVKAHDELTVDNGDIVYATNKCGGIVSGLSTGQDILCHLTVKPIPTVMGVETVDAVTHEKVPQHYERADVCVVPNVGVIADNILAYVIADELLKRKLL